MNDSDPWTIQRLLTWTADYFKCHDSDSPRLDAEVLLSATLGCQRIDLYTRFDQIPAAPEVDRFRELVKRRATGEPVAYLVQQKEFFALSFVVTPDVLIPRPETELVVVETLDRVRKHFPNAAVAIAEVGTGSGNIAIALAKHLPKARLVATEISPRALDVAKKNAAALGVRERIDFVQGDLLQPIADRGPFDFVVSNPPYIGRAERNSLPDSVVKYEPEVALFSTGEVGTEIIERLASEAIGALRPGGFLLLEISPLIAQQVRAILEAQTGWSQIAIKKDLAGLDRIAIAQKSTDS